MSKMIIQCKQCGAKYSFQMPKKIGVFKVVCPSCSTPKYFRLVEKAKSEEE